MKKETKTKKEIKELHIKINPFRFQIRELDDYQRIQNLDTNNAPQWAKIYVK